MKRIFTRNRVLLFGVIFISFSIMVGIISGAAATNYVAESGLSHTFHAVLANQLKPAVCTMNLTNIVVGGNGTQANDLILGSAGDDKLRGLGGDDCILGGDGNDTIDGGKNNDIIIGGAGDDDLSGGQNDDYLDGGAGNDSCDIKHGTDTTNDCEIITN